MSIARDQAGPGPAIRALGSQVKPTFMGPALAGAVYGGLLGGAVDPRPAAVHVVATFLALYAAHVKDSLVDFYRRGEDETLQLTPRGCYLALAVSGAGFVTCLPVIWWLAGALPALLTLPLWPLGYLHAPWLDRHPIGTSFDYAVGVFLVVLGGAAVQVGRLDPATVGTAVVFVPVVAAGAILVDADDVDADRRFGKRTVPAILGVGRARLVAAGLVGVAAAIVLGLSILGPLPELALTAAAVLGSVTLGLPAVEPRHGFRLAMGGTTVAAVLLLVAIRGLPW